MCRSRKSISPDSPQTTLSIAANRLHNRRIPLTLYVSTAVHSPCCTLAWRDDADETSSSTISVTSWNLAPQFSLPARALQRGSRQHSRVSEKNARRYAVTRSGVLTVAADEPDEADGAGRARVHVGPAPLCVPRVSSRRPHQPGRQGPTATGDAARARVARAGSRLVADQRAVPADQPRVGDRPVALERLDEQRNRDGDVYQPEHGQGVPQTRH